MTMEPPTCRDPTEVHCRLPHLECLLAFLPGHRECLAWCHQALGEGDVRVRSESVDICST